MMTSPLSSRRLFALPLLALMVAALTALPSTAVAEEQSKDQRADIFISSNDQFDAAHGVRSGAGTASNPYVISGWTVSTIHIKDTDAYVRIVGNEIRRQLILNWVGDRVVVKNNLIRDLRVNQNIRRTGEATSGIIANNRFGTVGQLRHWDGVFENNMVGTPETNSTMTSSLFPSRAVNFDGFNGAVFRNNTIYGYMDARLHGHHHSSSFASNSHYHGRHHDHGGKVDHSKRYHRVSITNNVIHSSNSYALAYWDNAHAVNDRTAASETNEELNKPHVHYTRINISENDLIGAGLWVYEFNASDERHIETSRGRVTLANNLISLNPQELFQQYYGIYVYRGTDLNLNIVGNEIKGPAPDDETPTDLNRRWEAAPGIFLSALDKGTVRLFDNEVSNRPYGVRASSFSPSVRWIISDLRTRNVGQAVYYDRSVANPPEKRDS